MNESISNLRHADHSRVPPIINKECHTLILGSMLSPKSEQASFYYAHPQNRFWRVISAVFDSEVPQSNVDKTALVLSHGIALWDVLKSCTILGASDSTICDVEFNDIAGLIRNTGITRIFTTGTKAHTLLEQYNRSIDDPIIASAIRLPSTSPQNCKLKLSDLITAYSAIKHE